MLKSIEIKNFLTIEHIRIEIDKKITAITGESGAGKSLILKAIDTIFSYKTSTDVIGGFDDKSSVKLYFELNIQQKHFLNFFGFDEDEIVIEKIIQPKKTKTYINHEPVSNKIVSKMSAFLINMISQNYRYEAFSSDSLLEIIDTIVDNNIISQFKTAYKDYQNIISDEKNIEMEISQIDKSHPEILLESIEQVNPKKGEYDELLNKSKRIKSLSIIRTEIGNIIEYLYEQDKNVEESFAKFSQSFEKIKSLGFDIQAIETEFEKAFDSIASIKPNLYQLLDIDYRNEDIDTIESRLFELEQLQRKFNKKLDEIVDEKENLLKLIDKKELLQLELEKILSTKNDAFDKLQKAADKLTKDRKKAADTLVKLIKNYLNQLLLENSIVEFKFSKKSIDQQGWDFAEIFFSANKDIKPDKIEKVASGGERSRFILSMKSAQSEINNKKETLILDEIESGISNETLKKMSDVLKKLSEKNQIILITHNEAISNIADKLYLIVKEFKNNKTKSFVKSI
jgi:DNA repair protein RecN (Recombination protein N)